MPENSVFFIQFHYILCYSEKSRAEKPSKKKYNEINIRQSIVDCSLEHARIYTISATKKLS
jgi:hypothetical protein